ncbi:hypothetical protein TNCV_802651 [Trichonephila clavipes]|nr:hypothetical protein TNCV_802651 [Trichonephila clavipes]
MKNRSHASRISSIDQSPSYHSAECKNSTFVMPYIADYPDMGLRAVLQSGCPKSNAYLQGGTSEINVIWWAYKTPAEIIFRQRPINQRRKKT